MSSNKILVTGPTGTVGKLVVSGLLSGHASSSVRALTRDPEKSKLIFGDKVEFVKGDLNDSEWRRNHAEGALKGIDRLFLLTLSTPDQPQIEGEIVQLAKKAGVRHVVKLSVQGASTSEPSNSLTRWHAFAEEKIIDSGVPFTILRPNLFLQNFLRDDATPIKTSNKFFKPAGNCRISHVDVRDIADIAVVVLTDPIEKHQGQTYFVSGPESLTYDEVAERISRVLGKKVDFVSIDDFSFFSTLKSFKMPDHIAHMLVKLFQFYRTNGASEVFLDTKIVTGNSPRSVEQFFADHKDQFI